MWLSSGRSCSHAAWFAQCCSRLLSSCSHFARFAECGSRLLVNCSHFARFAQCGLPEVAQISLDCCPSLDLLNVALICNQLLICQSICKMSLSSSLNCSHFAQFAQNRSGLLKRSHISLVLLTERAIEHMSEQIYERASAWASNYMSARARSERAYERANIWASDRTFEQSSIWASE